MEGFKVVATGSESGVDLLFLWHICSFKHKNGIQFEHLKTGVTPGSTCAPVWEPGFCFKRELWMCCTQQKKLNKRKRMQSMETLINKPRKHRQKDEFLGKNHRIVWVGRDPQR